MSYRLSAPLFLLLAPIAAMAATAPSADIALDRQFSGVVRPFINTYCISCHGKDQPEAELDLSPYTTMAGVIGGFSYWELVLERLEAGEMPPDDAKKHPNEKQRHEIVAWVKALRQNEAKKNAGDPGPVLARRLNSAEYNYTIRDLTGVDINPTKTFPVDPANQAGFDNSGESLAMSPALLKKYMEAARAVADHLLLKTDGIEFAPHPVLADTDRDKYAVLRIVDFYKRQPTDLADYFAAAWRYQHRAALGQPAASLAGIAAENKLSAKYLTTVWAALTDGKDEAGPLARLRAQWRELPAAADAAALRDQSARLRDFVVNLRQKLVPEVKDLSAPQMQSAHMAFVLWKDRQMAANRRKFDMTALTVDGVGPAAVAAATAPAAGFGPGRGRGGPGRGPAAPLDPAQAAARAAAQAADQALNVTINRGGQFIAPKVVTTGSSATSLAASRKRGTDSDPDLTLPADPAERARYEAAFARFADVFPDAFYITERGRVYRDAADEQKLSGRLLNAGVHSMTGFFRDDGPLYDLVLDDAGRRELDKLWFDFEFTASIPQRMHTSQIWFERTDSRYMIDEVFDPFRPEDKAVTEQGKIKQLAEVYLAKAVRLQASEAVQAAVKEHFELVAANIHRVEQQRAIAEPAHIDALLDFAARAYRRPLTAPEGTALRQFYRAARDQNGVDHEEAMRDCIAAVLMSPHFCYRIDLVEAAGPTNRAGSVQLASTAPRLTKATTKPLTDYALASRLSYFLWSSMPDAELLAHAAKGDLQKPEVLAAQARRMLKDARAKNFATEFAGHWLDFRRFEEHNAVDRERFPSFDNDLRQAMFEEPVRFIEDLVRNDRPVQNLLYGDYTFVNAPLAKHYGMPVATGSTQDWVRVEGASKFERGGLLPMAVFLTVNSPGLRTSPVKRGYWVVRRVLGERIPPPPPTVPELPADEKNMGELTLRETLAKHRENKACSGCHARFDSFGLVFEGFGAVGERREKDFGGRPVDARADFPGGMTAAGFTGLRDYIRANRESDFIDNLCRKLVAYGLGRTLLMSDDALVADMKAKLEASGNRFSPLVEAIVTSSQFRTKHASPDNKTAGYAFPGQDHFFTTVAANR